LINRDASGSPLAIYENNGLTEHPIYGSSRLGVHYRQSGTDAYQLTDHLGNVRAVIMKNGNNAVSLTAKTDYYPGGMPMPNRNIEGNYRYKFQGQEKDSETGKEAFELRLWDSRIGRWLTVDPAGQYNSPYLGMGNDPINGIDPDGGYKTRVGRFLGWVGGGFKGSFLNSENPATDYHKYGILKSSSDSNGVNFNVDFGSGTKSLNNLSGHNFDNGYYQFRASVGEASGLTQFEFWRNSQPSSLGELGAQVGVDLTYGTAENIYGTFSGKRFSGSVLQGSHRVDAGVNSLVSVASFGVGKLAQGSATILKSSFKLYNNFAKLTKGLFKGVNHAALRAKAYREMIRMHNIKALNVKLAREFKAYFKNLSKVISTIHQIDK